MLETVEGEEDFFIILSVRQALFHVKKFLKVSEINRFFKDIADEIPDDAEDDDE